MSSTACIPVRFIRHDADRFRINADRIGAVGGSSGGYLVSMLGALDGDEYSASLSPVDGIVRLTG